MSRDQTLFEFRFPDIGEGLTEGTIVELKVVPRPAREARGEALAVVETDKVVTEIPSPVEGVIVELPVSPGTGRARRARWSPGSGQLPSPRPWKLSGEPDASVSWSAGSMRSSGLLPPSTEGLVRQHRAPGAGPSHAGHLAQSNGSGLDRGRRPGRATPLARKIAADSGIDLSSVTGTGPGAGYSRRISRKDSCATGSAARSSPR